MQINNELAPLIIVLKRLREEGKILVAILFGSYANGTPHVRSDIDLAVYINTDDEGKRAEIIDEMLMAVERDVNILRLEDEEESPFIVQEALKGLHLVEPDTDSLYKIGHRVLHETESIRFRRSVDER